MHIGILGASFDPPHLGHKTIVENLITQKIFDEIWLMPAHIHPHHKTLSNPEHRLAMLELFAQDFIDQPVKINTFELQKKSPSYTYDTLEHFAQLRPKDKFSWIIGTDNLAKFSSWHKYKNVLQKYQVYVYPRPGYPKSPILPGMILLIGVKESDISSTRVKEELMNGADPGESVGIRIGNFLKKNHLFRTNPAKIVQIKELQ